MHPDAERRHTPRRREQAYTQLLWSASLTVAAAAAAPTSACGAAGWTRRPARAAPPSSFCLLIDCEAGFAEELSSAEQDAPSCRAGVSVHLSCKPERQQHSPHLLAGDPQHESCSQRYEGDTAVLQYMGGDFQPFAEGGAVGAPNQESDLVTVAATWHFSAVAAAPACSQSGSSEALPQSIDSGERAPSFPHWQQYTCAKQQPAGGTAPLPHALSESGGALLEAGKGKNRGCLEEKPSGVRLYRRGGPAMERPLSPRLEERCVPQPLLRRSRKHSTKY
ncbi:hypothetical protein cyc_06786 [Cyclospora cayetanensis]|uniref:Uncharacterized protein n=1 Tax=Cyclospora cayetanensis TaxID=88456 RepID=A0A1D3D2X3_9EIME|nr:hypothetical protein cyc_06786 [Cyclospora cayetanensis]